MFATANTKKLFPNSPTISITSTLDFYFPSSTHSFTITLKKSPHSAKLSFRAPIAMRICIGSFRRRAKPRGTRTNDETKRPNHFAESIPPLRLEFRRFRFCYKLDFVFARPRPLPPPSSCYLFVRDPLFPSSPRFHLCL